MLLQGETVMDAVITFFQEYGAMIAVGLAIILPLGYVFRKYTVPLVFYTLEYATYVAIFHVVLHGIVSMFSWFRGETEFKNFDGSLRDDFVAITTPLYDGFWIRELYSPEWLFYFELVIAAGLLYVVTVVRPTRFGKNNKYKGNKNAGYAKGAMYDRSKSAASRSGRA